MKRITVLLPLFVVALGLSGCGATANVPTDASTPGQLSGSDPDFATNMMTCLGADGWDVDIVAGNNIEATLTSEQQDPYLAAVQACKEDFGYDQAIELDESQLKELYRGLVAMTRCIEDQGYSISEIPSEQTFLESRYFDPYGELRDPTTPYTLDDESYGELLKKCPKP